VKFLLILLAAFISPWVTLAAVGVIYVVASPVKAAWQLIRRRSE
jgi:hypothetical protein